MTITEAIEAKTADDWIRPVSWKGSGRAIDVVEGRLMNVPSIRGAYDWCPTVEDVVGEWEVVTWHHVQVEKGDQA